MGWLHAALLPRPLTLRVHRPCIAENVHSISILQVQVIPGEVRYMSLRSLYRRFLGVWGCLTEIVDLFVWQ